MLASHVDLVVVSFEPQKDLANSALFEMQVLRNLKCMS